MCSFLMLCVGLDTSLRIHLPTLMNQTIFISNRYFVLFDAQESQGQLLIRSEKSQLNNGRNIDVIFFNTGYVQLPKRLRGVRINKVTVSTNMPIYKAVAECMDLDRNKIFEIESEGEIFYVLASHVEVYDNKLEFHETSLGFDGKGREKILASTVDSA
jgi:hypothetical protein